MLTDCATLLTVRPDRRNFFAKATPPKREGTSEEVVNLASFLASEEASFMTGNNVDINVGLLFF